MNNRRICSVENAKALDTSFRKLFQNPRRILSPYLEAGMTALDIGCGPGFFTLEMAKIVGSSGKVISADMQDGMLDFVRDKISLTDFENIVCTHKCLYDKIGLNEKIDFALMFWMLHEIRDQACFIKELRSMMNRNGKVLLCEPVIHVSKSEFLKSQEYFIENGFEIVLRPRIFLSRALLLRSS